MAGEPVDEEGGARRDEGEEGVVEGGGCDGAFVGGGADLREKDDGGRAHFRAKTTGKGEAGVEGELASGAGVGVGERGEAGKGAQRFRAEVECARKGEERRGMGARG